MTFTLRLPEESDREFLYELHRTTMREVIEETWGWDESWQRQDFDRRLAEDIAWIIEVDREKAGGLWLDWQRDALDIQELQICPAYQGRGLGTAVIRRVIEQGAECELPVTLSVVPANPRAQRLYERLGFRVSAVDPPFIRMRHGPSSGSV